MTMRILYFVLFLFVLSCKKGNNADVYISGNVWNVVTNQPMSGIKIRLIKQPKYSNQIMNGSIVRILYSDSNGNFNFTESLNDRFYYVLQIEDDSLWKEFPGEGFNYRDTINPIISNHFIEFKLTAKAYLRLNFVSHTGNSVQDTLQFVHSMTNGNSYYQPYTYISDLNQQPYSFSILFQGPQQTEFIFTKNGNDSVFTRYYGLSPGEIQVMDIDLY